ncbi:MAG: alkyl hydroperoxide reductase [Acidobacteriota bacterium]|nr:alkyl hydroperoxide reductase [Acidobacteriota bacterium]
MRTASSERIARPTATARWMTAVLLAAGIYNLAWGALAVLFPLAIFHWARMEPPNHPQIWQCVGMIVGVYGVGYIIAAFDPARHWPIVLVGLLGKLLGPIGFLQAALDGAWPWRMGWTIITNDLIWWIPFVLILVHAYRSPSDRVA